MPPVETVEEEPVPTVEPLSAEAEAEEDQAFASGYSDDPVPVPTGEEPPPVGDSTAEPDVAESSAPAPVTWTQEEYDAAQAATREVANLKAAVESLRSTAFGKMGGLERTLADLQAKTPAGQTLEVTAEDFEEMKADFPDIVDFTVKGLNRALSKANAKGTAPDPAALQKTVDDRVSERLSAELPKQKQEMILDVMDTIREDWREIVLSSDYTTWLKTQSAEYQAEVADSWKPNTVIKSIEKFEAAKTAAKAAEDSSRLVTNPTPKVPVKPAPAPATRRGRTAAAVAPKSAGSATPATVTTEDDAFNEAYQSGRVR